METLGRILLGILYAITPFGWYSLATSFKRVNPGEMSIVNSMDGTYELLEQGLYFRPFPGDTFGENFSKSQDCIDFGPVKRVRIKQGEAGVKNSNGVYLPLQPGIHFINTSNNETFNPATDVQKLDQLDYRLGAHRYITIKDGELGESYLDGKFVLLEHGKHVLPPNHIFTKKVSIASDIVDLGALKIVTVKKGQVAIINGPEGNIILAPGKHYIKQDEGYFFDRLITVSPQVLELKPLTVMCTDKIEMKADAVLVYQVSEALKTVGSGMDRVIRDLKEFAESTLRNILSKFSSADIAPTLQDAEHGSSQREKKLDGIHNEFVRRLDERANDWGIKVNDLQFTQILPADEKYHAVLRDLGVRQSTAESNKTLAEAEAAVLKIRTEAGRSKIIEAKIAQEELLVRAETDAKAKGIQAEADYNKCMQQFRAQAEGVKLTADAECERLTKIGKVADGFKSEAAKRLAFMDKQIDVLTKVKNPVFVQPQLGETSMWSQDDNRTTFFTTKSGKQTGSSDVKEYLALETSSRIHQLPQQRGMGKTTS